MTAFLLLLLAIGIAPLAVGTLLLKPASSGGRLSSQAGSILLCALAFNLTFFWQELWLVIPKVLTPGLHPVLYHNDHGWTGHAPTVELLQGTGALATLCAGLAFSAVLGIVRAPSPTWRRFLFWMAFQGLFQSLTQLAIGTVLPGNDMGRALGYLQAGPVIKAALLGLDVLAMAAVGGFLARVGRPDPIDRTRGFAYELLATALLSTALTIPFREPRDIVEVVLVPLFVNLVGAGWLAFGAVLVPADAALRAQAGAIRIIGPSVALAATLLLFQIVLRPGIAF